MVLKECSSQYSLLIQTHIVTGNEKLCNFYSKITVFFFKRFKFFLLISFIDAIAPIISSTPIACEVMCVQHVTISTYSTEKNFFL